MKRIQVGDFKIGREETKAIMDVLKSGRISEGPRVRQFESEWAKFVGTKYCVATSSGSGALITGLTALKYKYNLPLGTKVITTPITFIADSSAISTVGFEPVFVDVDPNTFVITPEAIENHLKKIKKKDLKNYKIILAVDILGYSIKIDKINKIAEKYNLLVFEDPAEAEGTVYKGKVAGSQALLADYSFYIAHNIQAGEMGALVTNDEEIYRLAKKIKAQGRVCDCYVCTRFSGYCPRADEDNDPRFYHKFIGYNFKTMEFQAALALLQLKRVKTIIGKRQKNVKFLNEALIKYNHILQLPVFSKEVSYLAYPLVIKSPENIKRNDICQKLEALGIETRPIFPCIPTQQPAYKYLKKLYEGKLPIAEHIGSNGFYIPCHQYLKLTDLKYIVKVFKKILGGQNDKVLEK